MSHTKVTTELFTIYQAKNKDYGNAFSDTYKKLGIISATTRISDKTNRLITLSTKPQEEQRVKDETIKDTLMDLANYAIMTIMELEKTETVEQSFASEYQEWTDFLVPGMEKEESE